MVTNALRAGWPGDVVIPDAESRGLLIPSKVRTAKIAATPVGTATRIGRLDEETWAAVLGAVRVALAL